MDVTTGSYTTTTTASEHPRLFGGSFFYICSYDDQTQKVLLQNARRLEKMHACNDVTVFLFTWYVVSKMKIVRISVPKQEERLAASISVR